MKTDVLAYVLSNVYVMNCQLIFKLDDDFDSYSNVFPYSIELKRLPMVMKHHFLIII